MAEEELIERIEAWRCLRCRHIINGDRDAALRHANTPLVKALRAGYVFYVAYDGKNSLDYFTVIRAIPTTITEDHDSQNYGISLALIGGVEGKRDLLTCIGYPKVSARAVRACNLTCSDEQVEQFKAIYRKNPDIERITGVRYDILTNKLD